MSTEAAQITQNGTKQVGSSLELNTGSAMPQTSHQMTTASAITSFMHGPGDVNIQGLPPESLLVQTAVTQVAEAGKSYITSVEIGGDREKL